MKLRDPKFGYHWIWIAPIALIWASYYNLKDYMQEHRPRFYNSRQKRLRQLAGMNKDGK